MSIPNRFGISKGVKTRSGDGWKDDGRKGDVCFVWAQELPAPYAPGQYPRVAYPVWSASAEDHEFMRPSSRELAQLVPTILRVGRRP